MPNRVLKDQNYRFGFNGKEADREGQWGSTEHYDYGFRIYDPKIARFLSVDPLTATYPMLTPYQFASNSPIVGIDLDGLEFLNYSESIFEFKYGTALIKKENVKNESFVTFKDTHGQQFIGTNRIVELYELEPSYWDGSTEFNLDPSYGAPSTTPISEWKESMAPGRRNKNSETVFNPVGKWDGRQTRRLADWNATTAAQPPAGSRGIGGIFLVKELYDLGKLAKTNFEDYNFYNAYDKQYNLLEKTRIAIKSAIESGLIPLESQNSTDLFEISDFVLQGNRDIKPANLEIGIRITKEITNNYKTPVEPNKQVQGMDNIKSNVPIYKRDN